MYKHGFCSSYTDVQNFERSAAVTQGLDVPDVKPGTCLQFVADNVDHNIRTLDGLNTFHGMGIIACTTPCNEHTRIIPKQDVANDDILALGNVHIEFPHHNIGNRRPIIYGPLPSPVQVDKTAALETLRDISASFNGGRRPGWNGFMQEIHNHQGEYPGKSLFCL